MGSMRLQRTTLLAHFAVKGKAFALRILTGKKHPQIKLKRLQKVWMDIWVVGTSNQFFISGSQKQSSYLQNSVLCDMSTLCSPFYFFLSLASDRAVLYENVGLSDLVLSTEKRSSSLLKRVFVFQKMFFKVKVLKRFKISSDCHVKINRSLERNAILEIPSTNF